MSQRTQYETDVIDWPDTFPRTPPEDREPYSGGFQVTRSQAFQNVLDELRGWDGVTDVQLDSGAEHQKKNPNKPYARASFEDPGVVVYFTKDGEQMAAACDRWDNPRDNAQDLYRYLNETRMQELRGTVTAESEYQKLRLPSGDGDAIVAQRPDHEVLEVDPDASPAVIKAAAREKMKEHHPDHGGDPEMLRRAKEARDSLLEDAE